MCSTAAIQRGLANLIALALVGGTPLMAADAPPRLDFSGSDIESLQPSHSGDETRFEFLEAGSSVSGVIQAPSPMATPPSRSASPWSTSLQGLQNGNNWLEIDMENGRPSASAFERAAGVRNPRQSPSQGPDTLSSESPSIPASGDSSFALPSTRSTTSFTGGASSLLDLSGGFGDQLGVSGRSLDPVMSSPGNPSSTQALGPDTALTLPILQGIPEARNTVSPQDPLLGLGSERLAILGLTRVGDARGPRSVRELLSGEPNPNDRRNPDPRLLGQDTTREELNPYMPRRREDFQFSRSALDGDSRLGIAGRSALDAPRDSDLGSLRSPSSGSPLRPSSLAPAIALPLGDTPRVNTRGLGQSSQYQFPSRKF